MMLLRLTVLLVAIQLAFAALSKHDYSIKNLEKLGASDKDVMYSGLMPLKLENNDKGSYFFWHAESRAESEEEIPLVIWLNGGPGCSSNVGLFYENGPYTMSKSDNTEQKYQLHRNEYSWTNVAHMVWVEQPLRTGFSVASNDAKDPRVTNEYEVGSDFHDFLSSFFEVFDHLKTAPLYIVGESYGGRYVPAIADEITRRGEIALAGIGVGNGVIDPLQESSYAKYAYYHGMIGEQAKEYIEYTYEHCVQIKKEEELKHTTKKEGAEENDAPVDPCDMMSQVLVASGNPNQFNTGTYNQYDDIFQGIYNQFFNDPEWQENINVRGHNVPGVEFSNGHYTPGSWTSCNDEIGVDMAVDHPSSSVPSLQYVSENGVRVLLYSGDLDLSCNIVGTTTTLESYKWLGKEWFEAKRALWKVGGHTNDVAGDISYLDNEKFAFLVVHKSGHLVPMDVPEVALDLITRLVGGKSFADQHLPSDNDYVAKLKATDGYVVDASSASTFFSVLLLISGTAMMVALGMYAKKNLFSRPTPSMIDAARDYELVSNQRRAFTSSSSSSSSGGGGIDVEVHRSTYQNL
jgi:carboxypeptidase C (cathepsin A)